MYVYLFDKRSMSLLAVVSAAAGLLLFSGGILLGLYFDLPAADPSPRAALTQPATGGTVHGSSGSRGAGAGGAGTGGPATESGAGGGAAGGSAGGGAASGGDATSGGTAAQGGAGTGGGAAAGSGSAPGGGSKSGGGSAPDGGGESSEPSTGDGAADDGAVPSVAYRGWARDRSAAALPPPDTAAPPAASDPAPALAPPATPAAAPAAPAAAVHAVYTVQVGAYSVEENAHREVSTLEAAGYRPQVVMVTTSSGRPLHAVLLGTYPDRGEAAAEAERFTSREGRQVWVRQLDSR